MDVTSVRHETKKPSRLDTYITKVEELDLSSTLGIDTSTGAWITIKPKGNRQSETQKWSLVCTACDLQVGAYAMNFYARQKLFESVIKTHSYYLGFQELCIGIDYFRKLF